MPRKSTDGGRALDGVSQFGPLDGPLSVEVALNRRVRELRFVMRAEPNKSWAVKPSERPTTMTPPTR